MKVTMKLGKVTNGALRYDELDGQGRVVKVNEGQVGVLYIRKTSEVGMKQPELIEVTVEAKSAG